jgi:hypothetical protein
MTTVVLELVHGGIESILKSDEVRYLLVGKAQAVASDAQVAAAAGGMPDAEFDVTSLVGKSRARASVVTANYEARRAEAVDRVLTRSVDAARR